MAEVILEGGPRDGETFFFAGDPREFYEFTTKLEPGEYLRFIRTAPVGEQLPRLRYRLDREEGHRKAFYSFAGEVK